jgi:hypothetical protein
LGRSGCVALACVLTWPASVRTLAAEPTGDDRFRAFASEQFDHDNNLFRLPSGTDVAQVVQPAAARGDHLERTSAAVDGTLAFSQQTMALTARATDNRFSRNDFLNHVSGNGTLTWNWRAGSDAAGDLGVAYSRVQSSFANSLFYGKDLIATTNYFADLDYGVGADWRLSAGARDNEGSHSADSRRIGDFHAKTAIGGIEYQTPATNLIAWEYRFTKESFPHAPADSSSVLARDYDDYTGSVRVKYELTGRTELQASAGYRRRSYDAGGNGFSGGVWRLSLDWGASMKTQITLAAWRDLQAFVDAESDYYAGRGYSIAPTWSPTEKLTFAVQGSWETQQYISSDSGSSLLSRRDRVRAAEVDAKYLWLRRLQLTAAYRFSSRDSNYSSRAYSDNLASMELRLVW